jgi:hypothetical protein
MTDTEKLAMLKALVGITDTTDDAALAVFLTLAARKILSRAYPYDTTVVVVPMQYDTLQCEIAAYLWNKRGAEGQTAHTENGINRQYENADVPASMLKPVTTHVGVIK